MNRRPEILIGAATRSAAETVKAALYCLTDKERAELEAEMRMDNMQATHPIFFNINVGEPK